MLEPPEKTIATHRCASRMSAPPRSYCPEMLKLDFYLDGRPDNDQDDSRVPQADLDCDTPHLEREGTQARALLCPQCREAFSLADNQDSLGSKVSVRGGGSLAGDSSYPGADRRLFAPLSPARSSFLGPGMKPRVIPETFHTFP